MEITTSINTERRKFVKVIFQCQFEGGTGSGDILRYLKKSNLNINAVIEDCAFLSVVPIKKRPQKRAKCFFNFSQPTSGLPPRHRVPSFPKQQFNLPSKAIDLYNCAIILHDAEHCRIAFAGKGWNPHPFGSCSRSRG